MFSTISEQQNKSVVPTSVSMEREIFLSSKHSWSISSKENSRGSEVP